MGEGGKGGEKGSGSGSESLRCLFVSDYLAIWRGDWLSDDDVAPYLLTRGLKMA